MMRGEIMKTVVYADILIIINTIVNYLLLRADALLTLNSYKTWRMLLSSFIGGIFSLIIFIENIPIFLNITIKIAFMSSMLLIAFRIKSIKHFIKHFFAFFAVNFIFGGIMLAINVFLLPNASLYNNGIIYFDIDILSLTIISVICYVILNVINQFTKSKTPPKSIYPIKITYNGKQIEGNALYDSGNTLCDCFSGRPVIIAEKEQIKSLIKDNKIENMKHFRIIPFSTIGGNGTLQAFMADSVGIFIDGKWLFAEKIYIGVTENKIISGGYSVLFGTPYFNLVTDSIKYYGGRL